MRAKRPTVWRRKGGSPDEPFLRFPRNGSGQDGSFPSETPSTSCSFLLSFFSSSYLLVFHSFSIFLLFNLNSFTMSETFQELADIPKDFVREGSLFIKRCTKPDKREFIKISQAVGMGFLVMVRDSILYSIANLPSNLLIRFIRVLLVTSSS